MMKAKPYTALTGLEVKLPVYNMCPKILKIMFFITRRCITFLSLVKAVHYENTPIQI